MRVCPRFIELIAIGVKALAHRTYQSGADGERGQIRRISVNREQRCFLSVQLCAFSIASPDLCVDISGKTGALFPVEVLAGRSVNIRRFSVRCPVSVNRTVRKRDGFTVYGVGIAAAASSTAGRRIGVDNFPLLTFIVKKLAVKIDIPFGIYASAVVAAGISLICSKVISVLVVPASLILTVLLYAPFSKIR